MASRKSSFIWNYFDEVNRDKAQCRLCECIFSRKGCCTSGLITHLKVKHTSTFMSHNALKNGSDPNSQPSESIKPEPLEDKDEHSKKTKGRKRKSTNDDSEDTFMKFENYACPASSPDSAAWPEDKPEESDTLYLNDGEYPVVSIEKEQQQPLQHGNGGICNQSQMVTILTKQLQIQAKLYKEMKERLEQIEKHLRETERNNRRMFRIKAQKLRLLKEDLKRKEEYRKEKHRLKLMELEMRSKKAAEEHLILNQM